ncbi:HPF/RaiA family ribosome-associated protein [Flavobacteriaceae bacterium 3-367]|uniref:HPF/RaiA family ribosome-associated protein n=1 Tax=Eudoraea algarum TaxID=3417568 RepID=UPI003288DCC6
MTIEIQYVRMLSSESLSNRVTEKLMKLSKKYPWIIRTQVFFKLENDPADLGKICEMELSVPGPRIFARSKENNFEKASAETLKDLERQLRKRKEVFKGY